MTENEQQPPAQPDIDALQMAYAKVLNRTTRAVLEGNDVTPLDVRLLSTLSNALMAYSHEMQRQTAGALLARGMEDGDDVQG